MNLKHRNLEQIRRSPQSAIQFSRENGAGGKTMVRIWDYAIGRYHHSSDSKSAYEYLSTGLSTFNDNKKNNAWREVLLNKFNRYVDAYEKLNFQNLGVNNRLKMNVHHSNFITGEIFRVDKSPDDEYFVTLQNRKDEIWAHELRFRLLQIHYSNLYKCSHELVKVGVYNFEQEEHEYVSFDESELNNAWDEIIKVSASIKNISN
jgi:hypothetical protein